jgi:hypothetical protein
MVYGGYWIVSQTRCQKFAFLTCADTDWYFQTTKLIFNWMYFLAILWSSLAPSIQLSDPFAGWKRTEYSSTQTFRGLSSYLEFEKLYYKR